MATLEWAPLAPVGARVELDLTSDVPPTVVGELRDLFDEHSMLVFTNQHLSGSDQKRVAGWFGFVPDDKDAGFVSNDPEVGGLGTGRLSFHSDQTASPEPFVAISLHAVDVTDGATSTAFVDAVGAAASLPATLRERVRSLHALHVLPMSTAERRRFTTIPEDRPSAVHPVLLVHPRTGVPILFVNTRTDRIVELDADDSETLLQELFSVLYDPANIYEHHWYNGDFVIWDNFALQHGRPPIPAGVNRTLQRVAVGTSAYIDAIRPELITPYNRS